MEMKQWLKGNIASTVIRIAASKVNMFEEGKKADALMDKQLGKKASEKIQRGTIVSLLLQFIRGLYAENPDAFAAVLRIEADNIKKSKKKKGK